MILPSTRFSILCRSSLLKKQGTASWKAAAWKSTIASAPDNVNSSSSSPGSTPELKHCPTLPFVGSTVPSYSNAPEMDPSKTYDYWPEMSRRFGEFYTMGIPGIGAGVNQTVYIVQDPQEMMKVLRSEGQFPSGAAQTAWGMRKTFGDQNNPVAKILDQGPEWKRVRTFLQTDLLSPQSARQYVPAIAEAAQYASKGVINYENDLNTFFEDASFDMFSSLTLGCHSRITDPSVPADPSDIRLCRVVKEGLTGSTRLMQDLKEMVLGKYLGVKTSFYKEFEQLWVEAFELAQQKVDVFMEKRENGSLTEAEKNSYLFQALQRQEENKTVTKEESMEIVKGLLGASVDTTAGMTAWHFLHISMHRDVQERIRDELLQAMEKTDGVLTSETISAKSAPYLHAAFRESHRLTNPSPTVPIKRIYSTVNIHGVDIPEGSVVIFDTISKSMNAFPDPERFDPGRWLPDAVEARKGTPAADLDHPLFRGPFSEGARKCPGSRVAKNEALLLIAQMILDWKMECSLKHWREVKYKQDTVITPILPNVQFTARS